MENGVVGQEKGVDFLLSHVLIILSNKPVCLTLEGDGEGASSVYVSWFGVVLHDILNFVLSRNSEVLTILIVNAKYDRQLRIVLTDWKVPRNPFHWTFGNFDNVAWTETTGWHLYVCKKSDNKKKIIKK